MSTQGIKNGNRIAEAFLTCDAMTLHVRKDHWHGVLSWLVPMDSILEVKQHDDVSYRVTFAAGPSIRKRWGLTGDSVPTLGDMVE